MIEVKVNGTILTETTNYTDRTLGKVTFTTAPLTPGENNVIIKCKKRNIRLF